MNALVIILLVLLLLGGGGFYGMHTYNWSPNHLGGGIGLLILVLLILALTGRL